MKLMVRAFFCENFVTKKSMRLVNNFVLLLIAPNLVLIKHEGAATNWVSQTIRRKYIAIGRKIGSFFKYYDGLLNGYLWHSKKEQRW